MRQTLGAVLLAAGRAPEAETAYREELERNPGNGWSLSGLARALRAQGKDARATEAAFADAWKHADVKLESSRL